MKYQQWNIAQRSQETCQTMERQGVPFLVAATLCARGMTDLNQVKALLSSGEDQLQDPFLLKDMDLAVARIGRALRNGEKMAVYGDYDVDGITSTCLLTHYLRDQGGDVCYYIPNRLSEGYGVNREAVDRLAQEGVRLIVTVDCGITAVEEVEYAKELGIDLVITDHHECKEELPAAVAVVDPHRKDCPYPFKDLAGVGVALKLVMALGGEKRYHALFQEYADLAAVGTVADVMKLLGENRTIVRVGLNHLKKTRRRGLYALMVEAGTLNRAINSTTVGYCLSPRINAAGRMGQAAMAVELILTENTHQAETMAHALCELNRQRQAVELARQAAALGAHAVASIPPKKPWPQIVEYYKALAAAGAPVIVYYIPGVTGMTAGMPELRMLLDIPGVVGIKMSDWNIFLLRSVVLEYPEKVVYSGFDEMLVPGLLYGADGCIGTWANLLPDLYAKVYARVRAGGTDAVKPVMDEFTAFLAVGWNYGIIDTFEELMRARGYAGRCFRRPSAWEPGKVEPAVLADLLARLQRLEDMAAAL